MKKPNERSNEIIATREVVDMLERGMCPRCEIGEISLVGEVGYTCAICTKDFENVPAMTLAIIVLPSIVVTELRRRNMCSEALVSMKHDIEQLAIICKLTPDQAFKMYEYFTEKLEQSIGVPLI